MFALRERVHLFVESAILAVDIVGQGGRAHHVIHRAIKCFLALQVGVFDAHAGQLGLPHSLRLRSNTIEIESGLLRAQVLAGIRSAHHRDAGLHQHRGSRPEMNRQLEIRSRRLLLVGRLVFAEELDLYRRLRELRSKVNLAVGRPARHVPPACNGAIIEIRARPISQIWFRHSHAANRAGCGQVPPPER